jgi:hypothetical protein
MEGLLSGTARQHHEKQTNEPDSPIFR